MPWSCSEINSLQWNLDLTNLYLTRRFSLLQFSNYKYVEENLEIMKPCRSEQICQFLAPLLYFGFYGLSSLHSRSFTEIMKHLHFLHNLIFPLEMLCVSPNSIVMVKQPFNMSMKHCKRCIFFWTPIFFVKGNHLICLGCQTLSLKH